MKPCIRYAAMYMKLPGIVMYVAKYTNVNTLVKSPVVRVQMKSALIKDFE